MTLMDNICETCTKYTQEPNPCLGVRGYDGAYTWGTPLHRDDMSDYPSEVLDSAIAPSKAEDCFGYQALEPAAIADAIKEED